MYIRLYTYIEYTSYILNDGIMGIQSAYTGDELLRCHWNGTPVLKWPNSSDEFSESYHLTSKQKEKNTSYRSFSWRHYDISKSSVSLHQGELSRHDEYGLIWSWVLGIWCFHCSNDMQPIWSHEAFLTQAGSDLMVLWGFQHPQFDSFQGKTTI